MIEHFALELCHMYEQMTINIQSLAGSEHPATDLHPDYKKSMARTGIQRVIEQHRRLDFGASVILRADMLHQLLMDGRERYSAELLLKELESIMMEIVLVLRQRKFAYIPSANAPYFEQEKLFGEAVYEKFPSARQEIKDAGNCLAASLPTASVFHLMRVAEYGLRAIAYDRRIKIPKQKHIELATWEDIIRELENSETEIQGYPKTLAREAQFSFYHGAMLEFKRFKNKYRNSVMHSRDSYNEPEALAVFAHVKAFMEILSSRIGEGIRTPKIWKGSKWSEEN